VNMDFIREINQEGAKRLFVEQLLCDLSVANDLRFMVELDNGDQGIIVAEKLPWDSTFFGFGIAKLHGFFPLNFNRYCSPEEYRWIISRFVQEAMERNIVYVFGQVDSRDLHFVRCLGESGFSLIETRLYYHMSIKNYHYKERFPVRFAQEEDIPLLGETARTMVNPYDRFHSDPIVSKRDADRLMYKWVEASVKEGFADVTLIPDVEFPKAFCTVRYHKSDWESWGLKLAQPVFSAVSTDMKGWNRRIISETNYHLKEIGAEHSFLITQITNIPVTWIWESLGYRYGKGEYVFRKNLVDEKSGENAWVEK